MSALPLQGSPINWQTFDIDRTATSTNDCPRPTQLVRKRTPRYQDFDEYRHAQTQACGNPGPVTDAQQRGSWQFVSELIDGDVAAVYREELRRK